MGKNEETDKRGKSMFLLFEEGGRDEEEQEQEDEQEEEQQHEEILSFKYMDFRNVAKCDTFIFA